jgi:MtN3 and saliva related transmembrane protein
MEALIIVSILATIFGTLMSVAHFPQAYRMWKRKSSKDVSRTTYTLFTSGTIVWIVYGILLNQWPVTISYSVGLVGCLTVIFMMVKYRK